MELAATLEQVATETYLADLNRYKDVASRVLMASAAGSVAFPEPFEGVTMASPPGEGAVNEPTPTTFQIDLPTFTRRRVIAGAALLGAGLVAAACGSDSNGSAGSSASTPQGSEPMMGLSPSNSATAADEMSVDLKVAGLAAGLEVLAVDTYKAALDAAGSGALGDVPPAVAEFVTVSMGHHQAHLDAWNGVLCWVSTRSPRFLPASTWPLPPDERSSPTCRLKCTSATRQGRSDFRTTRRRQCHDSFIG